MVSTHIGFPTETVIVFVVLAIGAIFIDLFMHRADKPITLKNAIFWSIFWVALQWYSQDSFIFTMVQKLRAYS